MWPGTKFYPLKPKWIEPETADGRTAFLDNIPERTVPDGSVLELGHVDFNKNLMPPPQGKKCC